MGVHFNPIVRILEYEPRDAHGIRGRTYTHPLDIDFIQDFDNVDPKVVDDMVRVLNVSVVEDGAVDDDLIALFYSTLYTSDRIHDETRAILESYGVRAANWSDYRKIDIRGIRSDEATRRYKRLITRKYNITHSNVTRKRHPPT